MTDMKQLRRGLSLSTKKTRKREFLEEMERVIPWGALVQVSMNSPPFPGDAPLQFRATPARQLTAPPAHRPRPTRPLISTASGTAASPWVCSRLDHW